MATILLEIGTEEVPAGYLPPALAQMETLARARFAEERLAIDDLQAWGTPRRLTLFVTGVADHQAPAVREVRGPAVTAAFASNGEPTQAAIGFARSQGVPVSQLRIKQIDSGEYVVATFRDEGRPTADLLPGIFTQIITGLTFPKTMRWGRGTFRFARPIRWLVALLDDQVIPLTIDDVVAGRLTRGHRFLASGEVAIPHAADYRRIMEENQVLVVPEARREEIRRQLDGIAQQDGATIVDDGTLLEDTTFHVEYPTAVRGTFEERFLALPRAVLLRVLRHEQHFFPLERETEGELGTNTALLPAFLAVRNGDKAYLGTVRDGYERVAHAKLIDAYFFYEQDRQHPLLDWVEELRQVVFQERLGTLHDKTMRVQRLAVEIAMLLSLPPEVLADVRRAALLAKADLVSAMVVEHPELQGLMGGDYARLAGETEGTARAIAEQYRPRGAGDTIPETTAGRVLALADKLDTVAACFAVGLVPTGSEDPYGLRREAQGVIRILVEAGYRLGLAALVTRAVAGLNIPLAQPVSEVEAALMSFLAQRLEGLLTAAGYPIPVIRAVLAVSADVPADAMRRAEVIARHLQDPDFATVVRAAARLANITRGAAGETLRPELLTEPAECDLYTQYIDLVPQASALAIEGDYEGLLALLELLAPAVDRFFTDVLVMAQDPQLRETRLALVARLGQLYRLLGDLSQLG